MIKDSKTGGKAMSALTDRICGEYIQWWTKRDVLHDDSERVFYSLAEVEYIAATAAAMTREACIAAVEALTDSLHSHYRITCEPPSPVEWSKHRSCDLITDIIAALREVQP
jgi:hypothetical protein